MTCPCGRMRLPGREQCGMHNGNWDDETAQALERIDPKRAAARKLADAFLANADTGDSEANSVAATRNR